MLIINFYKALVYLLAAIATYIVAGFSGELIDYFFYGFLFCFFAEIGIDVGSYYIIRFFNHGDQEDLPSQRLL